MKTTNRIKTALATAFLGASLMPAISAQMIGTGPKGIFNVTTATTLYQLPGGAQGITNEATNDGFVIGSGRTLLHLDGNRQLTTLIQLPVGATADGIAIDQDGSYVIASSTDKRLYRVTRLATFKLVTLMTARTPIRRITRDFDTGDFFVMDDTHVYSADRETGALTTLFANPAQYGALYNVAHLPHSGEIVVMTYQTVVRLTRSGSVISWHSNGRGPGGLVVDYRTDKIHTTGWFGQYFSSIYNLDLTVSGYGPTLPSDVHQVASTGQRRAVGVGTGTRGQVFAFRFNLTPNASFCGAISLGNRPSLSIGQGTQAIKPDALFFATLCGNLPFFTSGFAGTTDSQGRHTMSMTIPAGVPVGTVFYGSGSAFTNRIDFANTVCVKVR